MQKSHKGAMMRLFLLTFFLLYGGMHLYAFLKARAAFAFGTETSIYLILFMLLMVFAPFIVYSSEKHGFEFFARLMSYIGYIWNSAISFHTTYRISTALV